MLPARSGRKTCRCGVRNKSPQAPGRLAFGLRHQLETRTGVSPAAADELAAVETGWETAPLVGADSEADCTSMPYRSQSARSRRILSTVVGRCAGACACVGPGTYSRSAAA